MLAEIEKEEEISELKKMYAEGIELPPEPEEGEETTEIQFRLPDGGRRKRRFLKEDKGQILYDYVWSLGDEVEWEEDSGFEIIQNMPFKKIDDGKTLEEEGLCPKAVVIVQELD